MHMKVLGAAGTVTGSKYLVTSGASRVLIDCGLFQGLKELRLRNWMTPKFDPRELTAIILTHAHIDHSGYLPLLVKQGFRGPIYCSEGTADLVRILLPDSGHLQEEEARYANKHGFSKHQPALPLYTREESEACLQYLEPMKYGVECSIKRDFVFSLWRSGHIIGSSFIHLKDFQRSVLFSGDIGRPHDVVMKAPTIPPKADYLIVESTYGDRRHPSDPPEFVLEEVINKTVQRGGSILIPAFAVGRAQSLLYLVHKLKAAQRIPDIPVYLNSPMAINAGNIFCRHHDDHRLSGADCKTTCNVAKLINRPEESIALCRKTGPMIVISASGMATGGRVLHHLKRMAPDERNTILFSGFQAAGTRGGSMVNGADHIRIHGKDIPVRAEVHVLNGLSAHADYQEILDWMKSLPQQPKMTFITHGEPAAADAMRQHIEQTLKWPCKIPQDQEDVNLE